MELFICFHYSLEYKSPDPPRIILDKLDKLGYTLVTTCGIGQTCIWTLHKPDTDKTTSSQIDNTEYR